MFVGAICHTLASLLVDPDGADCDRVGWTLERPRPGRHAAAKQTAVQPTMSYLRTLVIVSPVPLRSASIADRLGPQGKQRRVRRHLACFSRGGQDTVVVPGCLVELARRTQLQGRGARPVRSVWEQSPTCSSIPVCLAVSCDPSSLPRGRHSRDARAMDEPSVHIVPPKHDPPPSGSCFRERQHARCVPPTSALPKRRDTGRHNVMRPSGPADHDPPIYAITMGRNSQNKAVRVGYLRTERSTELTTASRSA